MAIHLQGGADPVVGASVVMESSLDPLQDIIDEIAKAEDDAFLIRMRLQRAKDKLQVYVSVKKEEDRWQARGLDAPESWHAHEPPVPPARIPTDIRYDSDVEDFSKNGDVKRWYVVLEVPTTKVRTNYAHLTCIHNTSWNDLKLLFEGINLNQGGRVHGKDSWREVLDVWWNHKCSNPIWHGSFRV